MNAGVNKQPQAVLLRNYIILQLERGRGPHKPRDGGHPNSCLQNNTPAPHVCSPCVRVRRFEKMLIRPGQLVVLVTAAPGVRTGTGTLRTFMAHHNLWVYRYLR